MYEIEKKEKCKIHGYEVAEYVDREYMTRELFSDIVIKE